MGYIDCAILLLYMAGTTVYSSAQNTDNPLPDVEVHPFLDPASDDYKEWEEPSAPIYVKFYLFNVTNADDIVNNNTTPNLQQLGPYTYRLHQKKVNVIFHDNDTVSYEKLKWFTYEPTKSIGSLDDSVTTVNFLSVALAKATLGKLTAFEKLAINSVIRTFKWTLFITKSVDELLFGGYLDHMAEYLNKQRSQTVLPVPFGFASALNYTTDGIYNMYTGENDPSKFLQITTWQHKDSLPYWSGEHCNLLRGTDGSKFTPPVGKDDVLWIYTPDICRSIYMQYQDTTYVNSSETYRFTVPFSAVAAADLHTDNKCFCGGGGGDDDDGVCLLSGALSLANCRKGSPLVLTQPHFYLCDDKYYEAVTGVERNKTEHETFFDIDPTTGAVMKYAKRMQINVWLKSYDHLRIMRDVKETIFPLFWIDESMM